MEIPGERILPMLNCNHQNIRKFSEEISDGYKTVLEVIQYWVENLDLSS